MQEVSHVHVVQKEKNERKKVQKKKQEEAEVNRLLMSCCTSEHQTV